MSESLFIFGQHCWDWVMKSHLINYLLISIKINIDHLEKRNAEMFAVLSF